MRAIIHKGPAATRAGPASLFPMMTTPTNTWRLLRAWMLLVLALATPLPAWAHDPFGGNIQMIAASDKIEARVTLGYDAARAFFRASTLAPIEAARMTRPDAGHKLVPLPLGLAAGLVTLEAGTQAVQPSALLAAPSDVEVNLYVVFARPTSPDR